MNGNKPFLHKPAEFRSRFTQRIAEHSRVAYLPLPKSDLLVLMVIDEMLVTADALKLKNSVFQQLKSNADHAGTIHSSGLDDIEVWRLKKTPGKLSVPDVAFQVWEARKLLGKNSPMASHIAPNHVLVASPNYHSCPFGPPEVPPSGIGTPGLGDGGDVHVTVIDSGFVTGGPIDGRVCYDFGYWFTRDTTAPGGYAWVQEPMVYPNTANPLDQNDDCELDALVGHANFVAGVIAQGCPTATIDIVSHNGSFVENDSGGVPDTPITTEASVAKSLYDVLTRPNPPDLVNVGFAFPTLPVNAKLGLPNGPPSWSFRSVLDRTKDSRTLIVAPAGNQNTTVKQYPAAMHETFPNRVIGVGSVHRHDNGFVKSHFSNHGGWVACCTSGEDVVSAFVTWSGPTEEAETSGPDTGTRPKKDFQDWAMWDGTSFAAPKVVAAIAKRMSAPAGIVAGVPASPLAAWNGVKQGKPSPADLNMGILLGALPPT
ncbi:MAG TPA: S8/S53 family peptidase [Gaiellaceae bacterium]